MIQESYKEKLLRREASSLEKRIKQLDFVIKACPMIEIITLRQEGQKLLDENQGLENRIKPEFTSKISEMAKQEKYWFAIAKKQKDILKLIDKEIELRNALQDIKSDLYWMERRRTNA